MAQLKSMMTHAEAAGHLRTEVAGTAHYETGRLVHGGPAFFGAVRAILCDVDYVAALYAGWNGRNRLAIATAAKVQRFLGEVVAPASGNSAYGTYGSHLYAMYRVGTVHLRAPKVFVADGQSTSTPALSWCLMQSSRDHLTIGGKRYSVAHLVPLEVTKTIAGFATATLLPISIQALFDDFLSACEFFAATLEEEESAGDTHLLTRWRSAAEALVQPEPTSQLAW